MEKRSTKERRFLKAAIYANYRTQADFTAVAGMSELVVSQIITSRRRPTEKEKALFAKILNTPLQLLFPPEEVKTL